MSISIQGQNVNPNEFSFGNEIEGLATSPGQTIADTLAASIPELTITVTTPQGVIVIPPGDITIGQFSSALGTSINASHEAIRNGDLADLIANAKLASNELARAFGEIIARLQQLADTTGKVDSTVQKSNEDIKAMQQAIEDFNDAAGLGSNATNDANAINLLNTAIDQFNAGTIDEATYNAAVDSYNAYASGRNSTINAALTDYNGALSTYAAAAAADNAAIEEANTQIEAYNTDVTENDRGDDQQLTPLTATLPAAGPPGEVSLFTLASHSPPATVPISHVPTPVAVVDTFTEIPAQGNADHETAEAAAMDAIFAGLALDFKTKIALYNLVRDMHEDATEFYKFTLRGKNLFAPPAFVEAQTPLNFSVGGSSGGIIGATISVSTGDPKLSGNMADAANLAQQRYFQFKVILPNIFVVDGYTSFLAHDIAVLTGAATVSALGGQGITNPYAEKAFGTIFGLTHAQAIANVVQSGEIDDFANQFVKAQNLTDGDKVAANLSNLIKAYLLETALLTAATSANAPGLVQQINGNVALPEAPIQPRSVAEVLNDKSALVFVQSRLGIDLSGPTTSKIQTETDYSVAIRESLIQKGSTEEDANQIAEQAVILLRGEQTSVAIQNKAVFDQVLVTDFLVKNRVDTDVATQISSSLTNQYITNDFEYKSTVTDLLTRANIANAPEITENLYAALNIAPPVLSPDQLASTLYTQTYKDVVNAVGPDQATILASQSAHAYVTGPNSILTQLQTIRDSQTVETAQLQDIFRTFQSPSVDLFAFVDRLRDPGNTYLYCAATGLMYNGMPEPSNFKKSVDILV